MIIKRFSLYVNLPKSQEKVLKILLEYGKIEFASMCDDEDLEEESISGINMPPLDWTDPDVEVND